MSLREVGAGGWECDAQGVCGSERDSRSLGSHSMPVLGEARWGQSGRTPSTGRASSGVGDHGIVRPRPRELRLEVCPRRLPAVSTEAASWPFFLAVTNLPLDARRIILRSRHSMSK